MALEYIMSDPAAGREAVLTRELTMAAVLCCCCHSREYYQTLLCILTTPCNTLWNIGSSLQVLKILGPVDYFLLRQ